ncbi:MAG: hypothetical protein ABGW79_02845, partial [Pirellulales bacterium]
MKKDNKPEESTWHILRVPDRRVAEARCLLPQIQQSCAFALGTRFGNPDQENAFNSYQLSNR